MQSLEKVKNDNPIGKLFLIKIGVAKPNSEKSIYEYLKTISGVRLNDT